MKIQAQVTGIDTAYARLELVKKGMKTKILRKAVNAATKIALGAARRRAPVETGLLKKSLGRKTKTYRDSAVVVGIVGPRADMGKTVTLASGRQQYRDPAKTAHLVERGTRHSQARPFMRPAWEESKAAIEQALRDEINTGVELALS